MKSHSYLSNYRESTEDSRLVMRFLRENYGLEVTDLTDDKEAQLNGIDFRVGESTTVEFKRDNKMHYTGNIAFEIISNMFIPTPGCCLTSKAEFIIYYNPTDKTCHKFNLANMRRLIAHSERVKWEVSKATTIVRDNPVAYAGFSLLIPVLFIQENREALDYISFSLEGFKERVESKDKFFERLKPVAQPKKEQVCSVPPVSPQPQKVSAE